MKPAHVLFRVFTFKDGSQARVPLKAFRDQTDAKREGDNAVAQLNGVHPMVMQTLNFLGIVNIGHATLPLPMQEGAGLVVTDEMPTPPLVTR